MKKHDYNDAKKLFLLLSLITVAVITYILFNLYLHTGKIEPVRIANGVSEQAASIRNTSFQVRQAHNNTAKQSKVAVKPQNSRLSSKTILKDETAILVYISGAVKSPGLYELPKGTRVIDALKRAGGVYPNANLEKVNLAAVLKDGKKVHVIAKRQSKKTSIGTVDINSASVSQLIAIPGIGNATAKRIIAYRKKVGKFKSIHDLQRVKGIGQSSLKKLSPYLRL